MESEKAVGVVINVGFAILGFCIKYLLDYHYLKSPRVRPEVIVFDAGCNPPRNGYRVYSFNITINFFNYSENMAYGLILEEFVIDNAFTLSQKTAIKSKDKPLSSTSHFTVEIGYSANLKLDEATTYATGYDRLRNLSIRYRMQYSFYNALGKKYIQRVTGDMILYKDKNSFKRFD